METEFRKYLRDLLHKNGVWTATVEHRSGGVAGFPDLAVQLGEGLIPVETKVGEWRKAPPRLHSSRIRPAQIRFLDEALAARVAARLVIGVKDFRGWQGWMLPAPTSLVTAAWRHGYAESQLVRIARGDKLLVPVTQW